jgi:uncharacterized protein (UPF0264 family)
LGELLKNPWFLHFIAEWTQERDRARAAVCDFPIKDYATTMLALQTRGEAVAYDNVVTGPYNKYNEIVEEIKENERRRDIGDTGTGTDYGDTAGGLG